MPEEEADSAQCDTRVALGRPLEPASSYAPSRSGNERAARGNPSLARPLPNVSNPRRPLGWVARIPTPRGPGNLPVPPEEPRPAIRGSEPGSLVLQSLEEIESMKRALSDLLKRLETLEHRVAALESTKA